MDKRLLAAMGVIGIACRAYAEGGMEASETYFNEFPVVLSASRLVQSADDAPAAVTVISRDMIRASGAREMVDLFRLVPGMVVGKYKGHQPTLGFNGFADPYFRQLQVLIDGVSVYSPLWGGVDWNQLPITLEDVERIEVVRGPNAATFGANSFLGVVNIITRDPAVERGAEAVTNIGKDGIRDVLVRYAVNQDDLRYRLTAGQRADEGLDSYPDNMRTNFLNFRGHYRLTGSDELRLQAGYVDGSQGEGVYSEPNHTDGPRTAHFDTGSIQLRWTRMTAADEEFWLQFSHFDHSHRETVPYVLTLAPFGTYNYPLSYAYDSRRTDLEMQHTTRLAETLRGVWGAQLRNEGARSQNYFASDAWQTSSLSRLFGNQEWRPAEGWIVAGGAMFEKNSMTGSSLSPSIAVNREFLPGHTLRLRLANAHRTPTLYEDRVDWRYELPPTVKTALAAMGSPLATLPLVQTTLTQGDLDDEKIRSRDISYLAKFPDLHLNLEFGLFDNRLDGMIGNYQYVYPTVMGTLNPAKYSLVWGVDNRNSARVKGRSVAARWAPLEGSQVYLTGSRTAIDVDGPDASLIEPSAPLHAASLLVSQELPDNWQFSFGYYWVGSMRTMSGGHELPVDRRVDYRLAKRLVMGNLRTEIAFVVQRANGSAQVFELTDIDKKTYWLNIRCEY